MTAAAATCSSAGLWLGQADAGAVLWMMFELVRAHDTAANSRNGLRVVLPSADSSQRGCIQCAYSAAPTQTLCMLQRAAACVLGLPCLWLCVDLRMARC